MKIWIDADACPKVVKEAVFKLSFRLKLEVCMVANSYMNYPTGEGSKITFQKVEKGADIADFYIAEHVNSSDLVVTADIPLASLIVKKGATAINPRGELYTEENIDERLSVRNFMQDLRDSGLETGGPAPFGPKDRENFINALNRAVTKMLK